MATQVNLIRKLLSRERVIKVGDDELRLSVPSVAAAIAVRQRTAELQDAKDDGVVAAGLKITTAAVAACIDGLKEDDAARLVLATGGEFGDLAREAMSLCGLGSTLQRALAEGGADDPT